MEVSEPYIFFFKNPNIPGKSTFVPSVYPHGTHSGITLPDLLTKTYEEDPDAIEYTLYICPCGSVRKYTGLLDDDAALRSFLVSLPCGCSYKPLDTNRYYLPIRAKSEVVFGGKEDINVQRVTPNSFSLLDMDQEVRFNPLTEEITTRESSSGLTLKRQEGQVPALYYWKKEVDGTNSIFRDITYIDRHYAHITDNFINWAAIHLFSNIQKDDDSTWEQEINLIVNGGVDKVSGTPRLVTQLKYSTLMYFLAAPKLLGMKDYHGCFTEIGVIPYEPLLKALASGSFLIHDPSSLFMNILPERLFEGSRVKDFVPHPQGDSGTYFYLPLLFVLAQHIPTYGMLIDTLGVLKQGRAGNALNKMFAAANKHKLLLFNQIMAKLFVYATHTEILNFLGHAVDLTTARVTYKPTTSEVDRMLSMDSKWHPGPRDLCLTLFGSY
jgi:hypothetical protein